MNLPTIVIGLVVLAAVVAILGRGIYNKKRGKSGCGCNCGACPSGGMCHPK